MLESLKELFCDMAKQLTNTAADFILFALQIRKKSCQSETKKATLCAMHGVSVSVQTTQNTSLGQRSEAWAVSKEHGLLSVRINRC